MMRLRTGVLGLDILMQGGWTPGTINEIWGEPGSGKTTLALTTLANRNVAGRLALWISTKGTVDFTPDPSLLVAYPQAAEKVFELADRAAHGGVSAIVVDDANNLVRQREINGDPAYVPDEHREFKDELKHLKSALKYTDSTVLFLSQPRSNQRAPIRGTGISEKAAARVSLTVERLRQNKSADVRAEVGGKSCLFHMQPGNGINHWRELLTWGQRFGFIKATGTYYSGNAWKVQGTEQFEQFISGERRIAQTLEIQIRRAAGLDDTSPAR